MPLPIVLEVLMAAALCMWGKQLFPLERGVLALSAPMQAYNEGVLWHRKCAVGGHSEAHQRRGQSGVCALQPSVPILVSAVVLQH